MKWEESNVVGRMDMQRYSEREKVKEREFAYKVSLSYDFCVHFRTSH